MDSDPQTQERHTCFQCKQHQPKQYFVLMHMGAPGWHYICRLVFAVQATGGIIPGVTSTLMSWSELMSNERAGNRLQGM